MIEELNNVTPDEAEEWIYKRVSADVDEWLTFHKDEWFSPDDLIRYFEWNRNSTAKHQLHVKLYYETTVRKTPTLEKQGRRYRVIDRTISELDWLGADPEDTLTLGWPRGVNDGTTFGFDKFVKIYPGSIIVIAGVSNMGKSTWMLNFMVENMDAYKCIYMTSELGREEFAARMTGFDWVELLNGDGKPKFKTLTRYDNYHDIIEPDAINIIDYLRVDGEFWQVGKFIDQIKQKLNRGLAVIAIQKNPPKQYGKVKEDNLLGLGGKFSQELSRLYLSIDFEKLTVVKAKSWHSVNPNGKRYRFKIIGRGAKFNEIYEVQDE